MSGETPTPGFIDFMAPRDGIMVRHAIDIVFDSDFEIIEARMFWFNTGGQNWARNFSVYTRVQCVPQNVVNAGGPEAMCKIIVDFYNAIMDDLFGTQAPPVPGESPFPPAQDPDGLVNATRNLLIQYRVQNVNGLLQLVKP